MGNVAYPAPELNDLCPMGSVIAYVPIGSCEIPPARESLQESKATTETLAKVRKEFEREAAKAVQREIDKAANPQEAIQIAVQWDRYLPNGGKLPDGRRHSQATSPISGYTYKGGSLPAYIECDVQGEYLDTSKYPQQMVKGTMPFVTSSNGSYRMGAANTAPRIYTVELPKAMWCHGYTPAKFNANHKRKLRMACEQAGIDLNTIDTFVMVPGPMMDAAKQPGVSYIDSKRILDWEDVRKLQLAPRASRGGSTGRIPGSYDLVTEKGHESGIPGDKIRRNQPILYFRGNYWQYSGRRGDAVAANYSKFTVVLLQANRIDKFKRNVPEAKEVNEGLSAKRDAWVKGLTTDQRDAMWLDDECLLQDLRALDAAKVKDPALKRAIKVAGIDVKPLLKKRKDFASVIGVRIESKMSNPFDNYPLFDLDKADAAHLTNYLNCVYTDCK
jgi:hypothetical protein